MAQQQALPPAGPPSAVRALPPSNTDSDSDPKEALPAHEPIEQASAELSPRCIEALSVGAQLRLRHHHIEGLEVVGLLGVGTTGRTYMVSPAGCRAPGLALHPAPRRTASPPRCRSSSCSARRARASVT